MLRWFLKPLSVRQMRLLCANLLVGFALCGALQGLCWGRTQLDAGAALCADTLRLHIRAASDAVADQSAKLRVRDAVLAVMQQCPAHSAPEARAGSFCSFSWRHSGHWLRRASVPRCGCIS